MVSCPRNESLSHGISVLEELCEMDSLLVCSITNNKASQSLHTSAYGGVIVLKLCAVTS